MDDIKQELRKTFEVIAFDLNKIKADHPEFEVYLDKLGEISSPQFLWGVMTVEQHAKEYPADNLLAMGFLKAGEDMLIANRRHVEDIRTELVGCAKNISAPTELLRILDTTEPAYFNCTRISASELQYHPKGPDPI